MVASSFPAVEVGSSEQRLNLVWLEEGDLSLVGDRVTVDAGMGPVEMTVVGSAAFPRLNHGSFSTLGLGIGAMGRAGAFPARAPKDEPDLPTGVDPGAFVGPDDSGFEFVTVRLRDGATAKDKGSVVGSVTRIGEELKLALAVRTEQRPTAIDNYAAVRSTPLVLTGLVGLMAAATLGHLVASVSRRRRRDLALCAALGMRRAQRSGAVVIHAVLVAGASVLVGLPLGLAGGRLAWVAFASRLGVVDDLRLSLLAIAAVVPVVLATAIGIAVLPALAASRTPPAAALGQE